MQILSPGTRIGQYEIASLPMMGGMGVVYFALDHGNDGRPVALKTFRPKLLPDRAARDRFLREGTAWIELGSHPHIVRCYKVEYHDPTTFLVLELIAKEQNMPDASLRSWLIPGHPLPLEQALLFALQITRGMQYATEKIPGFVHRDLKPENILVGADKLPQTNINRLRVTDFGLVKTIAKNSVGVPTSNTDDSKSNQIQFTRGVGTPLYMAPEQWKGEPVGIYTDVYAFGCVLYEMLSGGSVAKGKTVTELQAVHCAGALCLPPANLPPKVLEVLNRSLALNATERYPFWGEVTNMLEIIYEELGKKVPLLEDVSDGLKMYGNAGWSYIEIGSAYSDMSERELAIDYFKIALELANQFGDPLMELSAMAELGKEERLLGNLQQSLKFVEQSLVKAREVGTKVGECGALSALGATYAGLKDTNLSIQYFKQALTIVQEIGYRFEEGNILGNLGAIQIIEDPFSAIQYLDQALVIARETNNKRGEGSILNSLGLAYATLNKNDQAIIYHDQACLIAREMGDQAREGDCLSNLGKVFLQKRDLPNSIQCYEQALAIQNKIYIRLRDPKIFGRLGDAYLELGESPRAIEYFQEQLTLARSIKDRDSESAALERLGIIHSETGNVRQSIEYLEQALLVCREIKNKKGEGSSLGNLGVAYAKLDDKYQAIKYFDLQRSISRDINDKIGESAASGNLGNVYMMLGALQDATKYFEAALTIDREIENSDGVARNSFNLARLYIKQEEFTKALLLAKDATSIWSQMGSPNTQHAQKLVEEISGGSKPPQRNSIEEAFTAFWQISSKIELRFAANKYPLLLNPEFINAVEGTIKTKIPPEQKAAFEQRLEWLRQIANQK